MVITRDLSNEQLLDLQVTSDQQALRHTQSVLAQWSNEATQRPEHFWWRQQVQIRQRIAESNRRSRRLFLKLAWSAALALIVSAAFLLRSGPAPVRHEAAADADHELLIQVERVMRSDGPASLEPAGLLVQEVSQNASPTSTGPANDKETNHEN
jgi:hypothetical protein